MKNRFGQIRDRSTRSGVKGTSVWILIVFLVLVVLLWVLWFQFGVHLVRANVIDAVNSASNVPKNGNDFANSRSLPLGSNNSTASNTVQDPVSSLAELGQVGDLFGGINALFAAIAVVGVFWAGALRRQSLVEARDALNQQQFESLFFRLLELTSNVMERNEDQTTLKRKTVIRRGSRALDVIAARHFGKNFTSSSTEMESLQRLVKVFNNKVYSRKPSSLGPYFRLLFQTFTLVHNASISENEKRRYANIARGQMSEGTVLLLALNGLSWRGKNFVSLIECFGLLEHMHPKYSARYKSPLLLAYRPHAFLGSKDRLALAWGVQPQPVPGVWEQANLELEEENATEKDDNDDAPYSRAS